MRLSFLTVLVLSIFMISACAPSSSQSTSYHPIPAQERASNDMINYTSTINLNAEQKKSLQKIFTNFHQSMDALRKPGVRPDKNEVDRVWSKRDAELRKIMTADQYKEFKDAEDALFKRNRVTIEERVNKAMFDFTSTINLNAEQKKSFQVIFTNYYQSKDALYKPGVSPDKNEEDELLSKRDAELQKIMSAEQFKGFKDAEDTFFKRQAEIRKRHN